MIVEDLDLPMVMTMLLLQLCRNNGRYYTMKSVNFNSTVTAAMQERTYQWMDIVFVDFGEISGDCLLRKSRPAIVLSGTAYNESSPSLL